MATPTRVSDDLEENEPTVADPMPPPARAGVLSSGAGTLTAPLPNEGSGLSQLPEQELSNSWREAIVDNRQTVAMLKKMGLPGPEEGSTASGPAMTGVPIGAMPPAPVPAAFATPSPVPAAVPPAPVAATPTPISALPPPPTPMLANPPPLAAERPLDVATGRTAGTVTNVSPMPSTRVPTPPRPAPPEVAGASRLLSLAVGSSGIAIAAAQVWNGSWGAGLSGWLAFGAACFAGVAGLLNSLLRGPGFLAVFGVGFFAGLVAVAAMLGVFLTGGPRTRILAESHGFLAPLAAYETHLSKGPPPEATPEPEASPTATSEASSDPTALPSVTPEPPSTPSTPAAAPSPTP